jgi:DNA-binding helix-hairpin-helix protein with protein kinase domain
MSRLTDQNGQSLNLGERIGKGGEGEVYRIVGRPDTVAKIYYPHVAQKRAKKIPAMLPLTTSGIRNFCAWPTGIVSEDRTFRGLTMPFAKGLKELHVLTGPKSRKAEFPNATFGLLVRVAGNVARAIANLHAETFVVGDINERGFLVGQSGLVTQIDCDSVQVITPAGTFLCEVGVANFTPPELQGTNLETVRRTHQHDAFGLAVLIFQLLFMGRHPFAGRYAQGAIELEEAIGQYRYAYSSDTARTGMEPPPHTLRVTTGGGAEIATLFERAFAPIVSRTKGRPTASDWVGALERLEKSLVKCQWNRAHDFVRGQANCPWCELEQRAGVDLFTFVPTGDQEAPRIDIEAVWRAIGAFRVPSVPSPVVPPPQQLLSPHPLPPHLQVKIARCESLAFEIGRARELLDVATRRASIASDRLSGIRKSLIEADPKLQRLDRLRSTTDSSFAAYMLAINAASIWLSELASKRLAQAIEMSVTSMHIVIGVFAASGIFFFLRRRFLIWRRQQAQQRFTFLWSATIENHPEIRDGMHACTSEIEEANSEAEQKRRLAEAMERDLGRFRDDIRQEFIHLKSNLDREVATREAQLRQATAKLSDLANAAKKFDGQLREVRATADSLNSQSRALDNRRNVELNGLRSDARRQQKEAYLDTHFIANADIRGITRQLKATLRSYNVETAADVTEASVRAAPGFGAVRTERMIQWRRQCENRFVFDPAKALDPAKVAALHRRHIAELRKLERDIQVLHDRASAWIAQFNPVIGPAKKEADDAVRALAQARCNQGLVDQHPLRS